MSASRILFWATAAIAYYTLAVTAAPVVAAHGPDLRAQARQYLSAERARQTEHATSSDIEHALAFLTDSVVYEHPRAGATVHGKDQLRRGMMGFLGSTRAPQDSIIGMMSSEDLVVVELLQSFETRVGSEWQPQSRHSIKVLEFEGDRIRRIIDYW
jgi:hypothetical protein